MTKYTWQPVEIGRTSYSGDEVRALKDIATTLCTHARMAATQTCDAASKQTTIELLCNANRFRGFVDVLETLSFRAETDDAAER